MLNALSNIKHIDSNNFYLLAGPCAIEGEEMAFEIAEKIISVTDKLEIPFIFKGSYRKANRSRLDSFTGIGDEIALRILKKVGMHFKIPTVTDIHTAQEAAIAAEYVDVLQIPAFLCRQTDMILAAADACKKFGRKLKIKKGQFLSPEETSNIVEKASHYLGKEDILLTERGSSFGYNNLVVDMASFQTMKSFGVKAVHDATHCVQRPGGLGDATGGKRGAIKVLARAAVAAGADGVFMEVHPEPNKALSDASTCLPIEEMKGLVTSLIDIYEVL